MNVTIIFKQLNPDWDAELAEKHFNGEETEDNFQFLWEDEIAVSEPVNELKVRNNEPLPLQGEYPNGEAFRFDIPAMTILDLTTASGEKILMGASRRLLKRTDKVVDHASGDTTFTFFLKGTKGYENPIPGVFIIPDDFPQELVES